MNGERGSEWVGWEYSLISDSDPPPSPTSPTTRTITHSYAC